MSKISIFASGSGSNAENIINYFAQHPDIIVDSIISNVENAYVLERAEKLHVDHYFISRKEFNNGRKILELMQERNIDLIVLAGFLQLIPGSLVQKFPIINIHPALLPKYGGKGMYGMKVHQAVKDHGDKKTGITIHQIDENYDEGKTLFQASCQVSPGDTPEDIANKVHALEYEHYPKVIEDFIEKIKKSQ